MKVGKVKKGFTHRSFGELRQISSSRNSMLDFSLATFVYDIPHVYFHRIICRLVSPQDARNLKTSKYKCKIENRSIQQYAYVMKFHLKHSL